MSKQDIEKIIVRLPELTNFGVGIYNEKNLSGSEKIAKFQSDRESLLNSVPEFEKTCKWLEQIEKTKRINGKYTSYGLKHIAEKDIGYITNGVFIAAAIHSGFNFSYFPNNPNVKFNVSERSIRSIIERQKREGYNWLY